MNKKTILGMVGVIVLGALGSALWDFSKPVLSSLIASIANFSTLGFESLRDGFYANAARSLGRPVGIGYAITLILSMVSLFLGAVFHVLSLSETEKSKMTMIARSYMMMCFIIAIISFAQLSQRTYVMQLANYYEILEVRASPFMSELEIKKTRALFSQVQTKIDFLNVTETLANKLRIAGESLPKAP
ncbi:hypothetical protein [Janthinobacterium sp. GMG1]|uniref:hypothetical protein n=1 Tax=Janthinobacterium sp. GMG1 TaxID=3096007 RepID=UPI002ACA7424|nr:hypothetical protein [Janthinobacterium sp. GMG1]MDZ5636924.1 hypothetical protein [Janthinobacterium sp. GMG1]